MHTEKQLQNYIRADCIAHDILCYKLDSSSARGFPDLVLMHKGQVVFVEVKAPNNRGRVSPYQVRVHDKMLRHGIRVHIIKSKRAADELIVEILENGLSL